MPQHVFDRLGIQERVSIDTDEIFAFSGQRAHGQGLAFALIGGQPNNPLEHAAFDLF